MLGRMFGVIGGRTEMIASLHDDGACARLASQFHRMIHSAKCRKLSECGVGIKHPGTRARSFELHLGRRIDESLVDASGIEIQQVDAVRVHSAKIRLHKHLGCGVCIVWRNTNC